MNPVPFFDDQSSLFHGVTGYAAVDLGGAAMGLIGMAFLLYQMKEVEPLPNKIGDFGEFIFGALAAVIAKGATQ